MRYALIIVVIAFADLLKPLYAQPVFKNYSVSDGLVSNYIRRIYQDSKGFLWIATWEGLSKYDGHQFFTYNTANGLSHNLVNDLYESEDGKLYVATNGGGLDIISGTQVIPKGIPSRDIVNRFLKSSAGPVIVSTDGQGVQELRNGKLIKPNQPFPAHSYNDMAWINDSLFIALSNYSMQVINTNYQLYAELNKPNTSFFDSVVYKDSRNRIWISSGGSLKLLTIPPRKNSPLQTTEPPARFDLPVLRQNYIYDIFGDDAGNLWIATSHGAIRLNPQGGYELFTAKDGLASDNVRIIYQDKEKNIWFGTTLGLSKLVTQSNVRVYTTENGMVANQMFFAAPFDQANVLAVGQGGIQLFNKQSRKFKTMPGNERRFFLRDSMGLTDAVALDAKPMGPDFAFGSLTGLAKDNQNNFFAAGERALYYFSDRKKTPELILERRTTGLFLDGEGCLWVSTWQNGLYRLRYATGGNGIRIVSQENFLPDQFIRTMFQDSKGNIWVGTRYNGVYRLAKDNPSTYLNFDHNAGLTSDWIKAIGEDRKGNIWVGSYMGLDKLFQREGKWHVFNFSRITSYFASINSIVADNDNTLWIATTEGMAQVSDGEMETLLPLPVYITKINSPDSVYSAASKLSLDYRHNQIQFEFSAPGFINEKQITYSYRLTGGSPSDWTDAGNQHVISYANLQPGSYNFEVRAKGWNGEWGQPAGFSFTINPPLWQTTWFKAVAAALIAWFVFYLFTRRVRAIRHESEMKQKIAEMEMMALRAQMNPHFIFNSLNSIDNLIQSNQREKATIYFSRFAKLIRSILENSKHEVIPCWKDMETLELYLELESLRWNKKFTSEIKMDERIKHGDYKVPPMVIQPYVENAIQHGLLNKGDDEDCRLFIEVKPENRYIKYIIEDNGVGRTKAGEYKLLNRPRHTSMGMQLTEKRIHLFNKNENGSVKIIDLYHDDKTPAGTRVEILINHNM